MSLEFIQGEADSEVTFTITDSSGNAVDVSTATLTLEVKNKLFEPSLIFAKSDLDFDKTNASSGIVKVAFTSADTNHTPATYDCELTIEFNSTNISKSQFNLIIIKEV